MIKNEDIKDQLEMFYSEVEAWRNESGMVKSEFSMKAVGRGSGFGEFLSFRKVPSLATLDKIAKATGKKLIICLSE